MNTNDYYKKILFCPLDFPTPPDVDYDKFKEWHLEQLEYNKKHNKTAALADGKQEYPWEVSWALWWNTYNKSNPWICDFDKKFPELVEYIKQYPFVQAKSISFLNQKESRDVYLHTDPDNRWGMRFYLKNELGEKLYFVKSLKPREERLKTMQDGKYNDLWENSQKEKIYARFPNQRCAWMLNSMDAFHGVEKNPKPTGNRISCVLIGNYDYKKLFELFDRSLKKYKDYAIFY